MFKQPPSQEWLEEHKNDGPDVVGSDLLCEKEAPEQTTVSGQKPLSVILDEVSFRAERAQYNYEIQLQINEIDVPALVKALRRAIEEMALIAAPHGEKHYVEAAVHEIAAILNQK